MSRKIRKLLIRLFREDQRFMSTVKRKKPIDPKHAEKLPSKLAINCLHTRYQKIIPLITLVFQYAVSKENYRRVFSWGNLQTGALGHTFKHCQEKSLKERLEFPKRMGFAERYEVSNSHKQYLHV